MKVGLRGLSVLLGVFLIFMGWGKTAWFSDEGILLAELHRWLGLLEPSLSRWYLETVAIPGAGLFAYLVPLGELAAGGALILGYRIKLAATLALVMIINFHFASGIIFTYGYMPNGFGLPVLGSLFALAVGGAGLPFSVSRGRRT